MTAPARPPTPPGAQERPPQSEPATLGTKPERPVGPSLPPTAWHNPGLQLTTPEESSADGPITRPEPRNGPEANAERIRGLRAVLADRHHHPARAQDNSIASGHYHCGRQSRGRTWLAIEVQAFCECGWATPWLPWATPPAATRQATTATETALDEHEALSTHRRYPDCPEPDGYHQRCGWFHDFQDVCPAAPTSTTGRVNRVSAGSSPGDRAATIDQLAAIAELRHWLDEKEAHGIIRARLAGCPWDDITVAMAATTDDVYNRWAPLISRYEAAGLLKPTLTEEHWRSR